MHTTHLLLITYYLLLFPQSNIFSTNRAVLVGGPGNSNNSRPIICESSKGTSQRCQFDTRNGVTLTRQLSSTSCRGNWFSGDGFIEVKNGCRA